MITTDFQFRLINILNPIHPASQEHTRRQVVQTNDDLHLIHVYRGSGKLILGSRTFAYRSPCVIHVEPFTSFQFMSKIEDEFRMINFHYEYTNSAGISIHQVLALPPVFTDTHTMSDIEELLHHCASMSKAGVMSDLKAQSFTHALTVKYLEKYGVQAGGVRSDQLMSRVKNYLDENSREDYVTLNLAQMVNLSVSQLNRRFVKSYGISPKDYWQKVRIDLIIKELVTDEYSQDELALNWGFQSTPYFSRWFRKMTGYPPGKYKTWMNESLSRGSQPGM